MRIAVALATAVALASLATVAQGQPSQLETRFRFTFTPLWAGNVDSLPPDPHWSPFVLAVSRANFTLFETGTLASPGVKAVAETGATGTLAAELAANPDVDFYVTGQRLEVNETWEYVFNATKEFPVLSVITMIAPSPDWFYGSVNSLVDVDGDGAFFARLSGASAAFDAGTDSGADYTSPNDPTVPQENVRTISSGPLSLKTVGSYALVNIGPDDSSPAYAARLTDAPAAAALLACTMLAALLV